MIPSWRDLARPIIHQVITDNKGKEEKEVRKALREAFPWGQRAYHPYKIWLDEINVQLGKKQFGKKKVAPNPSQTNLFDDPDLHTGGFDF